MTIVPAKRPQLAQGGVIDILRKAGVDLTKPALLGRRGYYRDTMGVKGQNDIGIYDDAIFLHSPTLFAAYNANTDPSKHEESIATLKCGLWHYRVGIHNQSKSKEHQYTALIQAAPVTKLVEGGAEQTGYFGINIHRGGENTTSSLGCQTIYKPQWESFIGAVRGEIERYGVTSIPYLLTEET